MSTRGHCDPNNFIWTYKKQKNLPEFVPLYTDCSITSWYIWTYFVTSWISDQFSFCISTFDCFLFLFFFLVSFLGRKPLPLKCVLTFWCGSDMLPSRCWDAEIKCDVVWWHISPDAMVSSLVSGSLWNKCADTLLRHLLIAECFSEWFI